jgi:hypothetical protein
VIPVHKEVKVILVHKEYKVNRAPQERPDLKEVLDHRA